jgi:FAD/FMN-containing dehydrogenase
MDGLAGLLGSTSQVGIVGYTMGGGFGWLGRKYGFNAASVREADLVTAAAPGRSWSFGIRTPFASLMAINYLHRFSHRTLWNERP